MEEHTMKKKLALLGAFLILCFAVGCGGGTPANDNETAPAVEEETAEAVQTEEQSEEQTEEDAEQSEEVAEVPDDVESSNSTETPDDTEAVTEDENDETAPVEETAGSHILVAYFSATGTTKGVAVNLAEALNADLYEIVPEEPYTAEDLNYNDRSTRATVEQNTPDVRPAIAGSVENMDQYDAVFIGYPIWWGDAPRIVSTFVESYSFDGKTMVTFCTSGGSGIATSERTLREQADGGEWLSGSRFSGGASVEELRDWAAGLGVTPEG